MKRLSLTISFILLLCIYANAQSRVDSGVTQDGMYINPALGFSYKYPTDWVVHGEETNERIRQIGKEKMAESGALSKPTAEVAVQNTYQLLTVFRHAVGTPGITFNPAILILAEKVTYAPGITNGKDYLLNVRALLTKARAQVLLDEPEEHHFAGWQFFRDNFALSDSNVRVVQSYFATIKNGYAIVFVFTGQDQNSVDEMAKTMDSLALSPPIRKGVTKPGSQRPRKPRP